MCSLFFILYELGGECDWTAGISACHAEASDGVNDYDSTR